MPLTKATQNVVEGIVSTGSTGVFAGSFQVGQQYKITSLGTTTQSQWNTIAGTTGQTYVVGSLFTAATIGTGSGNGAAAVARTLANRFEDIINVKDFGAVGDNIANDTVAIQNAITYATSVGSSVYFPKGTFSTTGINMTCGCVCNPGSIIVNPTNSTTTVRIPPGNYTGKTFYLPQIIGGLNGLLIDGASLAVIHLTNIANCVNGLHLQVSNSGNTNVDNDVNFNTINNCTGSAVKFSWLTTSITGGFQGNIIKGNFIINVKYGIHFYDANNGALGFQLFWDDTIIDVAAIDNLPTYAGNIGIYGEPSLPPSRFLVKAENFFGGMDRCIVGAGQWSRFYLGLDQAGLDYSDFAIIGKGMTVINTAEPTDWNPNVNTQWIPLTSSVNTRSSFNGGIAPTRNRFGVSITIPTGGWAAGTEQTFFAYHPFLTNYLPEIRVEPFFGGNLQILWAVENSTPGLGSPTGDLPYPNQIAIRFKAMDFVPAGLYVLNLTVHHTP
jgi:hypothetical protein